MFTILSRYLHKSIHLVHTTPHPPPPLFLNPRGMPVLHRVPELKPLTPFTLSFTPPTPLIVPNPVLNTRKISATVLMTKKTVKATRKYLRTSIKKVYPIIRVLKGLHVEDAVQGLEAIRKKPAEWIKNVIKAGIRSAINIKGMHEDRLYVKQFILGRNTGIQGIRRHAKGKMGRMLRPKTQITIVIEEKTVEELYKVIVDGKFSAATARMLRLMLLHSGAGYEEITKLQHYLTAKGRQQQKLMFKRKLEKFIEDQSKSGIKLEKEYARGLLLEQESKGFVELYWKLKQGEIEAKIAERLEVFNKNQKAR